MKHRFISKRYWKDQSTAMGNSDALVNKYADVINMSLGDPDTTTDMRIIEKAFLDAKKGYTKYAPFAGDYQLKDAIKEMYEEDYKIKIDGEELFIVTGGCLGMYLALEAILDDGDEVIYHAPYYTPYYQQILLARGVPVELSTYEKEGFNINIQKLEELINPRTKAIIINTPNNPSGCCMGREVLQQIRDVAVKNDLIVIADEIYGAFSYEEDFLPFMSLEGARERTITINSFSKNFTMTGWRVGNIIAPSYIIKTIQAINENVVFTTPTISQRAAIEAIRLRHEIQPPLVEEYRKRVMYAWERINNIPCLSVIKPQGAFYLFINIKKTGLSSSEAAKKILDDAHVLTIAGNDFGQCGEGYVRIACTVGIDVLKEAFDRIERAFKE